MSSFGGRDSDRRGGGQERRRGSNWDDRGDYDQRAADQERKRARDEDRDEAAARQEGGAILEGNRAKRAKDFSRLIAGGGGGAKSFDEVDQKL